MLDNFLFSKTKIPLLDKMLQLYDHRHKAIASNIANIGTTGYKRQEVNFENQLSAARKLGGIIPLTGMETSQQHFAINTADPEEMGIRVSEPQGGDKSISGVNNVDIDYEMSELAQNQLRFKMASRMMADSFRSLRKSITGGNG